MVKQLLTGVHNDQYNVDLYNDGSIDIYDYKNEKLITTFDAETTKLLLRMLKRNFD